MFNSQLLIPFVFLLTGFGSAYLFLNYSSGETTLSSSNEPFMQADVVNNISLYTPDMLSTPEENRLSKLENEVEQLKQQLLQVNQTLESFSTENKQISPVIFGRTNKIPTPSVLTQRLHSYESLIRGGIDQITAEDIVRRKNNFELKRLALQDRATRENYLNTQQYYDELNTINQSDISLRDELGDDRYDEYLFSSKQNNRIKISSVMLGSAAEEVGIEKGDVVLSYNNQRMFTWQELKGATTEGSLGEFVSMTIYRAGEHYSFTVPRGPLGIQLGATRLEP
ncbi:hypothetical protein MNBD_GAMMA05-60 [hydrothermal vent metagenome]|uniref:PDZ domain-containing protein n=1 Tax=hydrothermal vent metagenome TaxID=652676 RepID=A0A3B0X755_9ZZZZ